MHDIFAKNMQKWMYGIGGLLLVSALLAGGWYLGRGERGNTPKNQIEVVATFFPLADFAQEIGEEYVSVRQITPDGVEVHEYEPSPQDIAHFLSADVVLLNGGGLDAWAENLLPDAEAAGIKVVRMSDVVPFLAGEEEGHEEEGHEEEEEEHGHGHEGAQDPHAWLDSARAQEMVRAIAEALIEKDPAHAERYAHEMQKLREELAALDADFSETLRTCEQSNVLVAHDAFRYWELRYNIAIHAVAGISPEAEPSVKNMAKLIEEAKELGVTTVFFESPASTALAETIAQEIGASVDVLYTLEGRTEEQIAAGEGYTSIMRKNLHALAQALSCQP